MEVKVKIHTIIIKDDSSGRKFTVRTLRTAEDIAGYVEETEKDAAVSKVQAAIWEVYNELDADE